MVRDPDGKEIKSQLTPIHNTPLDNRYYHVQAYTGKTPSTTPHYWLAFTAYVPPLGFSTYIVSTAKDTDISATMATVWNFTLATGDRIAVIGSGNLKLHFDTE
ncbi:putative galactose mutarotase-like domain superfamily, glycosyl hydrolase, all-beta [Helianthus annuus]|nr:putative galactose mutarotase-like domain superfamily, glycosyl hydrolase, all-beta [Helianthus annuus]